MRLLFGLFLSFSCCAFAQEGEYGFWGNISLDSEIKGIIGANLDGDYTHHSYSFSSTTLGALSIRLESKQGQLGLAIQRGESFTSLENADSFETQAGSLQRYDLVGVMLNTIYNIVVVNESKSVHNYILKLEHLEANPSSLNTTPMASKKIGVLTPDLRVSGIISRLEDAEFASYHTYIVDVPEDSETLEIVLTSDFDLNLAVKYGQDIQSYDTQDEGGDWLKADFSEAKGATLSFTNPQAGFWYLDVIHSDSGNRPYSVIAQIR